MANASPPPTPQLSITSVTNPHGIDLGQSITITGTWTGGVSPYTVNWYTGPKGTTCPQETANVIATYPGLTGTSNSITVSPTTSNSYCLGITDSATPNAIQLSLNYSQSFITLSFLYSGGVAFSPSGTYAYVTNGGNNNVVIINTATNTVTNSITSGFNDPTGVAFSPSGTYAYVTNQGSDNVVIINTATNTVKASVTSGLIEPEGVAFSPSGTYAYVANFGSNVVIINTATNTVVSSITSGLIEPEGVAFSPSGTYAYITNCVSSCYNSGPDNVLIVNTATNTVVNSINSGFYSPSGVAFSPSGTYAYVADYNFRANNVAIINTATNTVTSSITSGLYEPTDAAFSPSGTYAYVTASRSNISIIKQGLGPEQIYVLYSEVAVNPQLQASPILPQNPAIDSGQTIDLTLVEPNTGTSPYSYQWYSGASSTCASDSPISGYNSLSENVSPTQTTYYCVKITDSSSSSPESVYTLATKVTVNPALSVPTISPSNILIDQGQSATLTYSWTGGSPAYKASIYSSQTSACSSASNLIESQTGLAVNSVSFAILPSSNTYYCAYISDNVSQVFAPNIVVVSGSDGLAGVAFSPSGTYAYLTNIYDDNILIVNTATNTVTSSIASGFSSPEGVAFSHSGTYAYVTNGGSSNVVIINTATNTVVNSITKGFNTPLGVAFSPSGTYAYVTNYNSNNVVIINTATNTVVNSITKGFNNPYGAAFSPSGTYAYVTNPTSGNLVIINTATNTVTASLTQGLAPSSPQGVAFNPSGTYAYVANCNYDCIQSYQDNVIVINTATNTLANLIELPGDPDPTGISFSPSETYAYISHLYDLNLTIINTGEEATNSITSEAIINPALGVPTLSESLSLPATVETGSTITLTATVSGGTVPYAYNYLITNTITNAIVANRLYTGISGTSNSFAWVIPSNLAGNTLQANVIITDSATTPETTNSVKSAIITMTNGVVAGELSPSSPSLNQGQNLSLTANAFGGTAPYSYDWYTISGSTAPACTAANQIPGQNANTITVSPSSTNSYSYQVIDSAVPNSIACSLGDTVTVHSRTQVSNPYQGGSTGFFGNLPGATTQTTSVSSTSTTILLTTAPVTVPSVTSAGSIAQVCNDTAGYIINYPSLNTTFTIKSGINSCFKVTALNESTDKVPSLLNRSTIRAINYTFSNQNVSANVTMHYRCSTPPSAITPFILRNGTWQEITPFTINVAACTVTFAAPADPTIGLFNISNQSTTTAVSTITANTTTILTTIPSSVQQSGTAALAAIIIIAIIVIAIIVYLIRKR